MSATMANPAPARSARSRAGWALLAATCALGVAWFYHWTLQSTRGDLQVAPGKTDYYNLLVDGFQDGHLYMKTEVAPALLALPPEQRPGNAPYLLDASLHDGHYYLYFGVVPAVLLHWPFAALTGRDLPDALAVLVLALAALGLGFLWWREMRRQFLPALGPKADWLAILGLGCGTAVPAVLRRPLFYEEAALSGWVFGALMLWALARAWRSERRAAAWLVVAGFACGLAAGSRANLVLSGVVVLAVGALLAAPRFGQGFRRGWLPALLFAAAGAAPVGAGLAAYNYARFGHVAEFGHSYQLGNNPRQMFRAENFTHNAALYYAQPPVLNAYFPYVLPPAEGPKPADYIGRESAHGEWIWAVLALLTLPAAWGAWRAGRLRFLLPVALWFTGNFLVTGLTGIRANRYMLDFHPALVSAVLLGAGWVWAEGGRRWRLWQAGLGLLVLAAVLFNVLASFQVHGFFAGTDPQGFKRLADGGDRLVWRTAPWLFRAAGGAETRLRWPARGAGGVLPVLTAGVPEFQDRLWVRLDGQGGGAFEWQHGDFGTAMGPRFTYVPGASSRLRIEGASFMPPVWHGWYGGHPEPERTALRRRLRVRLDEALVFDRDVPSHSTAAWLDHWHELREGAVTGLRPDTGWAGQLARRRGAVRLQLRLPGDRFGSTEPLAQTGGDGAWDVFMVRFTRPGYVQVGHDSAGQGAVTSAEFAVDYRQTQLVELELPAARASLAWNEHDTLQDAPAGRAIVRWNGRVVLESSLTPHPAGPATLACGVNGYASGCRASFAAEMRVAPFLEPRAEAAVVDLSRTLVPREVFLGEQGVLAHWQRRDGRQGALVWRRQAATEAVQLGWLDSGFVEWAGALAPAESARLKFVVPEGAHPVPGEDDFRPFSLSWQDREILAGQTDFFSGAMASVHVLEAAAWTVTVPPAGRPAPGRSEAAAAPMPGRIKLHLALPAGGLQQAAPLVSAGRAGQADLVFLRPAGPDTYLFGLDHWGVGAFVGRPVTIPAGRRFEIIVEMGSLSTGAEMPPDLVRVRLDGQVVLEARAPLYPVRAAEVSFGRNQAGFSTSGERFPGEIFSVRQRVP